MSENFWPDSASLGELKRCDRECESQCDDCHTLDNCVPASRQYGDLILCESCRAKYPARQPWRLDPEAGEYIVLGRGVAQETQQ